MCAAPMSSRSDSSPDPEFAESTPTIQVESEVEQVSRRRGSHMIAPVVSAAVQFWLRSQLDHVENLQVKIESGDRQFFSGCIQQVTLAAQKAVYQGLHLSQVDLVGEKIRVNLGQVLRGKPLRLLEPIPVTGNVRLQEADLNASLQAPLLANAVSEFLLVLLKANPELLGDLVSEDQASEFQNFTATIAPDRLTLGATLTSGSNTIPIAIRTGLQVENDRELKLVNPEWLPNFTAKRGFAIAELNGYTFDLGSETTLQKLNLEAGQIHCQGSITIIPVPSA
jgi:hypothetical protein